MTGRGISRDSIVKLVRSIFLSFFFSLHRIAELIGVTADQLWRISELLKFVLKISKLLEHLRSLRIFRVIIIRRNL